MDHEWIIIQLAIIGLYAGAWSYFGTKLIRSQGPKLLAYIGLGATAVTLLFSFVLLGWAASLY